MRLLFTLLLLAIAIPVFSQKNLTRIKYSIKDSLSGKLLDSVEVTLTTYCFPGWSSGNMKTATETFIVNKSFSRKRREPCEWEIHFNKEEYIVSDAPPNAAEKKGTGRVIYMRKVPKVKLISAD